MPAVVVMLFSSVARGCCVRAMIVLCDQSAKVCSSLSANCLTAEVDDCKKPKFFLIASVCGGVVSSQSGV